MTITTVYVPLSGTGDDAVALRTAFVLAKPNGAHVEAVIATSEPGEVVTAAELHQSVETHKRLSSALRTAARSTFAAEAGRVGALVIDRVQRAGTLTASCREEVGRLSRLIEGECRFADVIVFPPLHRAPRSELHDAFLQALTRTQVPILLCAKAAPEQLGRKLAAGWDGGLAAAHAVAGALPLLEEAAVVEVMTVKRRAGDNVDTAEVLEYLRLHGFKARENPLVDSPIPVAQTLLEAAADQGCDMLAVGGYGHSRTLETVFGGVTADILSHASLPVLMLH
jgi:nucleotide-binding universal stress UspA family protein